jgi:hypothetical protein
MVNVVTRLAIQDYALTATQEVVFRDQPLNDPTVFPRIRPWKTGTNYSHGDVVFFAGKNWFCIFAHISEGIFIDESKFFPVDVPVGVGAVPTPFDVGRAYNKGDLVLQVPKVYICTEATGPGAFDATKWMLASGVPGLVTIWTSDVTYTVGQIVSFADVNYYCTVDHLSGAAFDFTKFAPAPAAITSVPLGPAEPEFFKTPRGHTSIIWQMVRQYSTGLRRANALKGTMTIPYNAVIDGSMTAPEILKGTKFRLRKAKLPGPYQEIYGIVTSVNVHLNGDSGEAEVKLGFKVSVGAGLVDGVTKTLRVPPSFQFTNAWIPVDTRYLNFATTYLSLVAILGPSAAAQKAAITAEAGSILNADPDQAVQDYLTQNPNTMHIGAKGLPTLDIPAVDHGALASEWMYVPKGIILS